MKYFDGHRHLLLATTAIGFLIAFATRASILIFTTDMQFVRSSLNWNLAFQEINEHDLGKKVLGLGGFPFSTFSDCVMGNHGMFISPACENISPVWEFSIFLNTAFWSFLIFGLLMLYKNMKKKMRYSKKKA